MLYRIWEDDEMQMKMIENNVLEAIPLGISDSIEGQVVTEREAHTIISEAARSHRQLMLIQAISPMVEGGKRSLARMKSSVTKFGVVPGPVYYSPAPRSEIGSLVLCSL